LCGSTTGKAVFSTWYLALGIWIVFQNVSYQGTSFSRAVKADNPGLSPWLFEAAAKNLSTRRKGGNGGRLGSGIMIAFGPEPGGIADSPNQNRQSSTSGGAGAKEPVPAAHDHQSPDRLKLINYQIAQSKINQLPNCSITKSQQSPPASESQHWEQKSQITNLPPFQLPPSATDDGDRGDTQFPSVSSVTPC
jgi:hypothetical protein